jgi:glutamate synthase (NADPH/NADH) small chain
MGIPGEGLAGVYSANEYLTRVNLMHAWQEGYDTPVASSKRVAVVGGGNVAMDAARCARRLGAEVHVVYRRSRDEMPARAEEVEHAMEEGIQFHFLTNPTAVVDDGMGHACDLACVRMELGEPDEHGRRRPVEVPDSSFLMEVDTIIMALGTSPNPLIRMADRSLELNSHGCFVVDEETMRTSREGVYAGGDAVTGAATVILAMGAGKKAAKAIAEYLDANK